MAAIEVPHRCAVRNDKPLSGPSLGQPRLTLLVAAALAAAACACASAQATAPDGQRPTVNGQRPTADGQRPTDNGQRTTIEQLFAALAVKGERVAAFVERRHSVLFRNPPEVRGTLRFKPPGLLEREVTHPRRENVRIDGERVTVRTWGEDGQANVHQLTLAAQPQLAALTDALRAILAGDFAALDRRFVMRLVQPPPHWRLELAPRDDQTPLASVRLAGTAGAVERIEIVETSGDRTEILLTPRR
jgi:hypothetical protein